MSTERAPFLDPEASQSQAEEVEVSPHGLLGSRRAPKLSAGIFGGMLLVTGAVAAVAKASGRDVGAVASELISLVANNQPNCGQQPVEEIKYNDGHSRYICKAVGTTEAPPSIMASRTDCIKPRSLGKCEPCLKSEQCGNGRFCCPYMKKCVKDGSEACFGPWGDCNPRCHDSMNNDQCQCPGFADFPVGWQHPTCTGTTTPSPKPSTTPAPNPSPAPPAACDESISTSDKGASYRGCQKKTKSGKTCQEWDSQTPHKHGVTPAKNPNSGLEDNFCRNPDGEPSIWCYTTDPNKRWELCAPVGGPTCDESESFSKSDKGASYRGCQKKTKTGKTCQAWDSQTPHKHGVTPAKNPNSGLEDNFCRNPDGEPSIWCYTTDPNKRWEICAPVGGHQ